MYTAAVILLVQDLYNQNNLYKDSICLFLKIATNDLYELTIPNLQLAIYIVDYILGIPFLSFKDKA
jgi:hypothetical protein